MDVSRDFWKGKKVFVTGHTGFKGGWLALWLQRLGADVVGYALAPPTVPSLYALARVGDRMRSLTGDVRDAPTLHSALARERPDIVMHLAALPLVLPSYEDPVATFATNTMGTVNVLEAVRHCPSVRVLINVTSDKCYQNHERDHSFRETDPMGGLDPYSASKGCAELVSAAYRRSFFERTGAAVATVRAGNVIGGGDWSPYRIVPDVMRALLERRPIVVRRPEALRPWQHVLEPLRGYLMLAERLWCDGRDYADAWNFGPARSDAWPVARLVDVLIRLWGEDAAWQRDAQSHPAEATLLRLDCRKAEERLGWSPVLPLAEALDWVVEWFKAYRTGAPLRAVTEAQIARYETLAASRGLQHVPNAATPRAHTHTGSAPLRD